VFRFASNEEIPPHAPRDDEEQFPVMLYVSYMSKPSAASQIYAYRFIFARQPVTTARAIVDLGEWLALELGLLPQAVIVLSTQMLDEEVTR